MRVTLRRAPSPVSNNPMYFMRNSMQLALVLKTLWRPLICLGVTAAAWLRRGWAPPQRGSSVQTAATAQRLGRLGLVQGRLFRGLPLREVLEVDHGRQQQDRRAQRAVQRREVRPPPVPAFKIKFW